MSTYQFITIMLLSLILAEMTDGVAGVIWMISAFFNGIAAVSSFLRERREAKEREEFRKKIKIMSFEEFKKFLEEL